ncbi:HDOD domain-containing protein [Magnetococcales bacterium HHB-1]
MGNNPLKQALKQARKQIKELTIPSRPPILLEASKAFKTFAPNLEEIIAIFEKDVLLAATLLKHANTDLKQHKERIASIQKAVILLGFEKTREVVNEIFLDSPLIRFDNPLQSIRDHSLFSACAAREAAILLQKESTAFRSGYLPTIDPEEAYTLGLFHDAGLLLLMRRYPDYFAFYENTRHRGGTALIQQENQNFKTNHCLMGAAFAESLHLPKPIPEVILTHHDPETILKPGEKRDILKHATLHGLLVVADHAAEETSAPDWDRFCPDLSRLFNLSEDLLNQLTQHIRNSVRATYPEA